MSDDVHTELTVAPPLVADVAMTREPDVVLSEARRAAHALTQVIDSKPHRVVFNGQTYLQYEDWQTVGRFYGVTAKVVSTNYIEIGHARGYEARAVALRADGAEISAADSQCLDDERNWRGRPLFQLRSMAQTRACAKALRNVLSWVVVLGNFAPTPAEELDDAPAPARDASAKPLTKTQQRVLVTAAETHHWPLDVLRARLRQTFHVEHTRELHASDFERVLAMLVAGPEPVEARDE